MQTNIAFNIFIITFMNYKIAFIRYLKESGQWGDFKASTNKFKSAFNLSTVQKQKNMSLDYFSSIKLDKFIHMYNETSVRAYSNQFFNYLITNQRNRLMDFTNKVSLLHQRVLKEQIHSLCKKWFLYKNSLFLFHDVKERNMPYSTQIILEYFEISLASLNINKRTAYLASNYTYLKTNSLPLSKFLKDARELSNEELGKVFDDARAKYYEKIESKINTVKKEFALADSIT